MTNTPPPPQGPPPPPDATPPGPTPPPPPQAPQDPAPEWWQRAVPLWAVALMAIATLLVGVGIGAGDDSGESAAAEPEAATDDEPTSDDRDDDEATTTTSEPTTTTRPTTTTTQPTTTTTAPELGTREDPFPLGTPLATDDGLEVTVTNVDPDAAGAIAAENRFNDPQPEGMRYLLVHLDITNNSDEPIHPWIALRVNAIGSQNRVHDSCRAVLPNDLDDEPELYPGGSAAGNVCVLVPEVELDDGSLVLMVAPRFGDPVFVNPWPQQEDAT